MIDLIIASRALAGKILNNPNRHVDFVVSIGDPEQNPPSGYHWIRAENKLRLIFYDYLFERHPLEPFSPTLEDINKIVNFTNNSIKKKLEEKPIVLIHCAAGISRSTATAQIILEELGLTEQEAISEVLRVRPQARPNSILLKLYRRKNDIIAV